MNPAEFAPEVVLVSAPGVLSPGPLFFANIIYGSKMGITAGIKIAYGHTMVELPLIIILELMPQKVRLITNLRTQDLATRKAQFY